MDRHKYMTGSPASPGGTASRRAGAPVRPAPDHIRGFLADHHGRRIGVAAEEHRHDGLVGNTDAPSREVLDGVVGAHPKVGPMGSIHEAATPSFRQDFPNF